MTLPNTPEFLGYFPLPAGGGPTARPRRGDLSRDAARASDGHAAWERECPCACGGTIHAASQAELDIRTAVERHNATGQHLRWREERDA